MTGEALPVSARVLVVHHSESSRYVLAAWLRRAGHDVAESRTGEEALAAIARRRIDLVVLDVNLADMSGYAVCERIKTNTATATIPVLHVSAESTQTSDRSEGLRRGADGFLVEPIEREELDATVAALLRGAAAHNTAVRLSQRLRHLNDATLAVNEASSVEQLIGTIVREASVLFDSAATVAVIVDEEGYGAVSSGGERAKVFSQSTRWIDALRKAVGDETSVPAAVFDGLMPYSDSKFYLAAALNDFGGHRGVLLLEQPELGSEDDVVLTQYARAAGTALTNVRTYDIERRIALKLQQNLLPDAVPSDLGIDVAVRYKASAAHAEVGGDFYEIFALDNDRVAIAIGDVVGHSLEAAMIMAQLRMAIRSYLLEGHGPVVALDHVNRLLRRFHPDAYATACCAIYDTRNQRCELANAGHLPPLIVGESGAQFLPLGGTLLGIDVPTADAHSFELRSTDVLLMYTDGLVERRYEPIDEGLQRLAAAANGNRSNLDDLCERLLHEVGPASILDDIALVAIRPSAR